MHHDNITAEYNQIMTKLLNDIGKHLSLFLDKTLSKINKNWWDINIIPYLSENQFTSINNHAEKSTMIFDIAAMLRILDKNWFPISDKFNYSKDKLNYVKEMQTIRNRWAHVSVSGIKIEDIYRDLDTMKRFSELIHVPDEFLCELKKQKDNLISENYKNNPNNIVEDIDQGFSLGQSVVLKSDESIKGVIQSVIENSSEMKYKVFTKNGVKTFYASQLLPGSEETEHEFIDSELFHAYITAQQIKNPSIENLYSLNSAKIDFIPYQFRPVLKFIKSDRPRLLIADSVGVGKTIEAGLILKELQSRREINSVLIICPKQLITEKKWQNEMKRFDENFVHIDGKILKFCIEETDTGGEWPDLYKKSIIPYSLFDDELIFGKKKKGSNHGLIGLNPPPKFDLVIVDEAHHIKNENSANYNAVKFFCDNAEAVVFLTATPIQMGSDDLFVLLNVLRDDLVIDRESFTHMVKPNPHINKAINAIRSGIADWENIALSSLNDAILTEWGSSIIKDNPDFIKIKDKLLQYNNSDIDRITLINEIEKLHTFSGIINRTRRRDIGDFTIRNPITISIEFTPIQKEIHDELLLLQMELNSIIHSNINLNFLMTTIKRQASSSIFALIPCLKKMFEKKIKRLNITDDEENEIIINDEELLSISDRINSFIDQVSNLDDYDPKFEALCDIVSEKQKLANKRIILFSSFIHTLEYLYDKLKQRGYRVGLIYGEIKDEERMIIRERFMSSSEDKDSLDILLFSEIGCEGLDYQFCDCMINYDIPWNPMKIEQRIGRIDRNGQKSEKVAIYNFITPGTIDAIIYERCFLRIGIFENSIGASEEILGDMTNEIKSISESLSLNLSEIELKLQQLADNKIRLIKEQEALEQNQVELFGLNIPKDEYSKEIENASSYWLSPNSLKRLISEYVKEATGEEHDIFLGEKSIKTLRLSQENRNILLKDFQSLNRIASMTYKEWDSWLKGNKPHIQVTFDTDTAANSNIMLISPLHPLVKQASRFFKKPENIYTLIKASSEDIEEGIYDFAIYQWEFSGIRDDMEIKIISSSEDIEKNYKSIFENSFYSEDLTYIPDLNQTKQNLDDQHYQLWLINLAQHKIKTAEMAEYKKQSLINSHKARIRILTDQLEKTVNEKIVRMRQAQIENANNDFERRLRLIENAVSKADIITECIAQGFIEIIKEHK